MNERKMLCFSFALFFFLKVQACVFYVTNETCSFYLLNISHVITLCITATCSAQHSCCCCGKSQLSPFTCAKDSIKSHVCDMP